MVVGAAAAQALGRGALLRRWWRLRASGFIQAFGVDWKQSLKRKDHISKRFEFRRLTPTVERTERRKRGSAAHRRSVGRQSTEDVGVSLPDDEVRCSDNLFSLGETECH